MSDVERARERLEFALGCWDAACTEGLYDRIDDPWDDDSPGSLAGLFARRLNWMPDALREAVSALSLARPAPDDAVVSELEALLAKATPGPWSNDMDCSVRDDRGKVSTTVVYGERGDILFDMSANEDMLIVEESDGDEHGTWIDAHDAQALANADLIVFLRNNAERLLAKAPVSEDVIQADRG